MKTSPGWLRRVFSVSLGFGVGVTRQAMGYLEHWQQRTAVGAGASSPGCLQAIIDGIDDEVLIINHDYRVRLANNAVRRRLGSQAAIGEPCFRVRGGRETPCAAPFCECPLESVLRTGQTIRLLHTEKDSGTEKWLQIVAAPVWDSAGRASEVIEVIRDVTESRRLQGELLRVNRELVALNFIGRTLSQSLDLRATLQPVLEATLDVLAADFGWIRLSSESGPPIVKGRGTPPEILARLEATVGRNGDSLPAPWQSGTVTLKAKGVVLGVMGVANARGGLAERQIELLGAIANQVAVAVERHRLYQAIKAAGEQRGELLQSIITAQEEERRRLARELHDGLGQDMTALRLCLERMAMSTAPGDKALRAQLAKPLALCQRADEDVDRLMFDLRPALLDDLGLVEAIRSHAEARLGGAGIRLVLKVTGTERRFENEREVALFRVLQEAISNIIRHSGAKRVRLQLAFNGDHLQARVEDDGRGFEVAGPRDRDNPRHGMGLLGMRERVNLVGGSLSIVSKPGSGTSVTVMVPLAGERIGV